MEEQYSKVMNYHFRVKVVGHKLNTLVGWQGLKGYVGYHWAKSLVLDALNASGYKYMRRLRRGLRIEFYAK